MSRIEFDVTGVPVPQGSTRSFARNGRHVTTNDPTGRIERWRGDIRQAAQRALPADFTPLTGPLAVSVVFRFPRPKSHYLPANSRRRTPMLRPDAPVVHDQDPDLDKLLRSLGDALEHVVYVNDHQIATYRNSIKVWDDSPGAWVTIEPVSAAEPE